MRRPAPGGANPFAIPRLARVLRGLAVALLASSAALTLAFLPAIRRAVEEGRWPRVALALPPALLGLFICGYAVYRLSLVRARRYPAGKALAQLGLMLLALGVVTGVALEPGRGGPRGLAGALASGSAEVRAMAAELARHRPADAARPLLPRLIELLEDPDPEVRAEAHRSLVAITGKDLGEGEGAPERWRAELAEAAPR